MNTIDYGKQPGMMPAPMTQRYYDSAGEVEKTITVETDEWKAYYRLSSIYNGERILATYYLDDVEVKEK